MYVTTNSESQPLFFHQYRLAIDADGIISSNF